MKPRLVTIIIIVSAIVSWASVPACAQSSKLIQRMDVNGDGKVQRDELPAGSATQRMFDSLVVKYKLDPKKTYTLQELEDASGLSTSNGSETSSSGGATRSGDSSSIRFGSSGGSFRLGDPRQGSDGPNGFNRGGSTGSRRSRPRSDGRPYRAVEELPGEYRTHDKDGDGQVGLYEWPKDRIRDFIALDRNDDGFLTVSELKKPSSPQIGAKPGSTDEKKPDPVSPDRESP